MNKTKKFIIKIIFTYPFPPFSNKNLMKKILIQTDNLCLSFPSASGKLQILNSVNFSLYENETVALVDPQVLVNLPY